MTKEKLQELLHKIEMGYFCKKDCFECYNRSSLHFSCIHVAENLEKELNKENENGTIKTE